MEQAVATEHMVKKLNAYFQNEPAVLFAFLFGSHAAGSVMEESDVDIAVYFSGDCSYDYVRKIWSDLETLTRKDVDLIVLNNAAPLVAWAALRGKPVIIKDFALYMDYMLRTSQEAEDFSRCVLDIWNLRQKLRHERALP